MQDYRKGLLIPQLVLMMNQKLLLINAAINSTSTGRIAEEIGRCAVSEGFDVYAGYGFTNNNSSLKTIRIGGRTDHYLHALMTRLTDRHGFMSAGATESFLKSVRNIKPDVVNIHNIHGYYMNVEKLAEYLAESGVPVVWTFHDCWPFTGHCSYFDAVNCSRWESGCHDCPNLHGYPSSKFKDNSVKNYRDKKRLFSAIENLTIVCPCNWMAENVKRSFLGDKQIRVIYNGVNTDVFKPGSPKAAAALRSRYGLDGKRVILGVASVWDKRKGLDDFIRMTSLLNDNERIVLIGLDEKQIAALPANIIGIRRTENVGQLADFYSMADVFANPTYVDNFPTTNIEALACGTPVVTYNTGGSPEAIDSATGRVTDKSDFNGMLDMCRGLWNGNAEETSALCRHRAVNLFDSRDRFKEYVDLFKILCTTTH